MVLQVHIDGGACRRAVSGGAWSGQSVFSVERIEDIVDPPLLLLIGSER